MASSSKKPFRIPKRKSTNDEDDAAKQPRLDSNTIDLIEAAPPAAGFSLKLEAPAPPPAKPPPPPPPAPSFIRRHVQQQKSEPVGPPAASKQQLGTVVPDGWLDCAKGSLATALHGICAIKSPMTASLTQHLPPEARWTPMDAVMACGARRVRLIVDLTSTVRYYQPEELPTGIRHLKLPVSGHSVPSEDALAHAIKLIREIRAYHGENSIVLVHCTHGLNRTGQQSTAAAAAANTAANTQQHSSTAAEHSDRAAQQHCHPALITLPPAAQTHRLFRRPRSSRPRADGLPGGALQIQPDTAAR